MGKITTGQIVMPFVAMAVGAGLLYVGLGLGQGMVWVAAGWFFMVLGVVATLFNLAAVLPAPFGPLLRHPLLNFAMLVVVLGLLINVVVVAIRGD